MRLALEALALRAAVPVLLRTLPLDRALGALTSRTPAAEPSLDARAETLARVERATDLVTRRVRLTRSACLERALLRYALLRRHGLAPGFVIGVRPGGRDGFEAHAFVTLDGKPIMEREAFAGATAFEWPAPARAKTEITW